MPINDQTTELLDYEREMQLRMEEIAENYQIKKTILKKVESMSISDFQNAVDEFGISGNTVVDEMVENLVEYLFEQREASKGEPFVEYFFEQRNV